jgi:hypothetical protein
MLYYFVHISSFISVPDNLKEASHGLPTKAFSIEFLIDSFAWNYQVFICIQITGWVLLIVFLLGKLIVVG